MSQTTPECFEDLMGRLQQLPDFLEKRKQLAELLGVEDSTIRRWMSGSGNPAGMSMISLRAYLNFLGYKVKEFEQEPEVMRDASRLLAFRVLTLDEMTKLVDFGQYTDQVLAVLRGARGISKEREERFVHMVDAYRQELENAQRHLPKLVMVKQSPAPSVAKEFGDSSPKLSSAALPAVATASPVVKVNQRREERFKGLALNLLDFAQYYANPEVPEEVRDRLRSVVGQQNIFDLKNLLARLCSSKAFSNQQ